MATAKRKRKVKRPSKSKFGTRSLGALIKRIHENPDVLEQDWRKLVRGHFQLSSDEGRSLTDTPVGKVKKIQKFLLQAAQHIRKGGQVTGNVVKRSPSQQTKNLMYDVDVKLVRGQGARRRKG